MMLHLLFIGAAIVYIVGGWLDYHNSLGRGEQNPQFQNERGYFDPRKFIRMNLITFIITVGVSLLGDFLLSPWVLVIGISVFLFIGIRGMVLSRR